MIALDLEKDAASALYLDVHHVEMTATRELRLCALLGDGWYEGEVLIEVGAQVRLTLADLYLDEASIRPFLERVGREPLERAIAAAVTRMRFAVDSRMGKRQSLSKRVVAYHHGGCTHALPRTLSATRARTFRASRRSSDSKAVCPVGLM